MVFSSIDPRDQLMDLSSYPIFDSSMGYPQIKSEPTIFVMLSYSWLFLRAYTIISFGSDQCYHLFTQLWDSIFMETWMNCCWAHQQHFYLLRDCVEHPASIGNFYKHYLHDPLMEHMSGWKKWPPLIHVHLMQVAAVNSRKSMLPPLEPSQVSHACAKYAMVW